MPLSIAVFLICVIAAFIALGYGYVLYWKSRIAACKRDIKALFDNKFALCGGLSGVVADIHSKDSAVTLALSRNLTRYIKARDMAEFAAADRRMSVVIKKIDALVAKYPLRYISTNYETLSRSLTAVEEKIEFSRQFYNDAVEGYNEKLFNFPMNIVSAIFSVKREAYI
ncbi:MAG: LemA family protein [Clostridiales bacterium]|jgi:LemA protein|nr:LemA family protein [Clostridiales bacterium]